MVGEIRDAETATTAVQAGLTGHLVFSTVHAPSAAGVFTRLTQLGVEPYLVASSVTAVVAQRLVRRVCEDCAGSHVPSDGELAAVGLARGEATGGAFRRGRGCEACGHTGYRGRTGVFALLPVTGPVRDAIIACRPLPELEAIATQDAAGGLWECGLAKAVTGTTTLDELASVLGRRVMS
jgi:type II secretory ATPase GspE/PulE/Tfp pilus assembly ATPase PilB-like protein